jgi:hypothetical protein
VFPTYTVNPATVLNLSLAAPGVVTSSWNRATLWAAVSFHTTNFGRSSSGSSPGARA